MKMRYEEILPDEQIDAVWGTADFGSATKRHVVKDTLVKCLAGYYTGATAKSICIKLDLIFANKWLLTSKGRKYLGEYLLEYQSNTTPLHQQTGIKQKTMETYKFLIPGRLIPSLRKAAKDISIDILSAKPEGTEGHYMVELMTYSPFALINAGMIMGMDQAILIFNEPSDEAI